MMGVTGAILGFLLKAVGFLLLFILAVLVIVLITPVKIGVVYPELSLWVSWNGIKYTILPAKKKDKKDKEEKPEKPKKPKKKPAETAQTTSEQTASNQQTAQEKPGEKPKKKKESFVKRLTFEKIKKIIGIVLSLSRKILKGIVFEQLYMVITIADEDKAKMAQDYGKLCILLIETQPMLEKVFTIKDQHINVGMDFSKSETAIACDVIMYVRPGTLLIAVVAALIKILKEGIL